MVCRNSGALSLSTRQKPFGSRVRVKSPERTKSVGWSHSLRRSLKSSVDSPNDFATTASKIAATRPRSAGEIAQHCANGRLRNNLNSSHTADQAVEGMDNAAIDSKSLRRTKSDK